MESAVKKKIRVTIINVTGTRKIVVVDAGDWNSLIQQASDKFRMRKDHIRFFSDWSREEIQRKDFTPNISLDPEGGLKLLLMDGGGLKEKFTKTQLPAKSTTVPVKRNNSSNVNYTYTFDHKYMKKESKQQEVVVENFVFDETLPPLALDETSLGVRTKPHGLFEVLPFLYLGEERTSRKREMLMTLGITHILNVATHCTNHFPDHFTYLKINAYDDMRQNLIPHFEEAIRFIEDVRKSGNKVLIHCQGGISRSTSFIIAYLMKMYNKPLNYCHSFLRSKKSSIKPNDNFIGQLRYWETKRHSFTLNAVIEKEEDDNNNNEDEIDNSNDNDEPNNNNTNNNNKLTENEENKQDDQ